MTSLSPDPGCTPGSTDEQLPAHILSLLTPYPLTYLSTACEAAGHLAQAHSDLVFKGGYNTAHPDLAAQLLQWRRTMHSRCRLNNKFTGIDCSCFCHASQGSGE